MPLSSGDKFGPYEILAPLGAGGMGEVYRARDIRLNRDVAIKILPEDLAKDPSRRARFEQECFLCFFMRSLLYLNGRTPSPFTAEPEQLGDQPSYPFLLCGGQVSGESCMNSSCGVNDSQNMLPQAPTQCDYSTVNSIGW
jgi:hypothetical protein